jgi:hypothetical protein
VCVGRERRGAHFDAISPKKGKTRVLCSPYFFREAEQRGNIQISGFTTIAPIEEFPCQIEIRSILRTAPTWFSFAMMVLGRFGPIRLGVRSMDPFPVLLRHVLIPVRHRQLRYAVA